MVEVIIICVTVLLISLILAGTAFGIVDRLTAASLYSSRISDKKD